MIKGIIVDFNKLFQVDNYEYEVLQELFKENNGYFPISLWKAMNKKQDVNPFIQLEKQTKKKFNHELMNKIKTQRFFKRIAFEKGRPEIEEVLNKAASEGIKTGLVANFGYKWTIPYLKKSGYLEKFDCIKTADDFGQRTIGFSVYEEAAKSLSLNLEECVVIGNSLDVFRSKKRV